MARSLPLAPSPVRWLAVAVVGVAVLVASLSPGGAASGLTGPLGVGLDKYLHAAGFGVFALTLAYALATRPARRAAVTALAGAVAFGLAVELLQWPLPYRAFSWLDLAADALGATAVAAGWPTVAGRVRDEVDEVAGE